MTDLVVIVPSRGRPEAAEALVEAFDLTCTCQTKLIFAVDATDPTRGLYPAYAGWSTGRANTIVYESKSMVEALNLAAVDLCHIDAAESQPLAVGFMGDDHRPRSRGWDASYLSELYSLGTGMVYGNDLLQGQNLPTQVAMTSDIVRALGYMAPPSLRHLYVDNYWRDLGNRAGCLTYLPEVVVEHMHPVAGKAEWTPGHRRVNTHEMFEHDQSAYDAYVAAGHLTHDVETVRKLRGGGG
jgi:hypothetical protein